MPCKDVRLRDGEQGCEQRCEQSSEQFPMVATMLHLITPKQHCPLDAEEEMNDEYELSI